MAKIQWEGNEIELVEDWRVGELIEAENALDINMNEAKGAAQIALVAYISLRRGNTEIPTGVLADQVLRMELTAIAADEEAAGPLEEGGATSGEEAPGEGRITGLPPLESTG